MRLSRYTVMLDACLLYSAPLRDLLIELAQSDLYRAKWTKRIEQEWLDALIANRPDLTAERLWRTCKAMRDAVEDSDVIGYESLVDGLILPDPNDRHVLAAAIHAKCDAIVTLNLKDFPDDAVAVFDMEILHPDATVITAARRIRARLANPPVQAADYIGALERYGLPKIASALRPYTAVI
jgi:predicted nucleic acid-binding protein